MRFPSKNHEAIAGVLAMVGTGFLWSIAGLFIKVISWNPIAIAGLRSLVASLVILVTLRKPRFHFSFPQVAAAVANAGTMILFVSANKTTTAANAILLQYIAPVLTAFLGAAVLKERVRNEHWIAIGLVITGMVVMFMDRLAAGRFLGNILAILSGVTFSFYFIFMRMQKDGSPLESILLSHWLTAGICLIISLFLPVPVFDARSAASIAVLGVVQIGFSALLFAEGIKRISAVSANLIAIIEPVFNPLWVYLALHEKPGMNTVVGGFIIVLAVVFASLVASGRKTGKTAKNGDGFHLF